MRIYWAYVCDFGHPWHIERDDEIVPNFADQICSKGHPAVTWSRDVAMDLVEIRFRPAGRVVNPKRPPGKQNAYEKDFLLVLTAVGGTEEVVSQQLYMWREVLALAERFQGRPVEECFRRMRESGL